MQLASAQNVPLWLGEFGENSNAWGYDVIRAVEQNGIGWCWWTYKKIDTIGGPMSAPISPGYQGVLDYWNGKAPRPSRETALAALLSMAEDLAYDRCALHSDVAAVLVDMKFGSKARPFKTLSLPGTVNAVDYDIGNEGVTYHDAVSKVTSQGGAASNFGWAYRNDGVDVEGSTDPEGFNYDVGWIEDGEWLSYTVNVSQTAAYQVDIRTASSLGGGNLRIYIDDVAAGQDVSIASTGGWQSWRTVSLPNVSLSAGQHVLKLLAVKGGFNLNTVAFRASL